MLDAPCINKRTVQKKRHGRNRANAHQATGGMGGRGKCPRYLKYRPKVRKSLFIF